MPDTEAENQRLTEDEKDKITGQLTTAIETYKNDKTNIAAIRTIITIIQTERQAKKDAQDAVVKAQKQVRNLEGVFNRQESFNYKLDIILNNAKLSVPYIGGGRKLYHRKRKSSRKKKSRRNNKSTKRIKRHSRKKHSKRRHSKKK